ncbi:UNVERIFIED_CONTAM: hypothetical protein B566_EDAN018684, partial [Ephemera danica]
FVCALESAARVYPLGDVYLLVAYNPTDELQVDSNEALDMVLKHHHNIQVLNVDMDKLFNGTPLEDFHQSGILKSSDFLPAHTSDIVRFLTLWLYGGKYFDMDVITFKGNDWSNNGPRVITDAMRWYTNQDLAIHMNPSNLKEFHKLNYEQIFPLEYYELFMYFYQEDADSEYAMNRINSVNNLIGIHIGNNNMKDEKVVVGSNQAYSLIAQKYCPRSYWSAHMFF